jgi:hypothetical protein
MPIHSHDSVGTFVKIQILSEISSGWLFGHDPPEYEYDENHATVKLMEADA